MFCRNYGIQVEARSPLMQGKIVDIPAVGDLAGRYGRSPAQVALRWNLQHQVVTIPKSSRPDRIEDNAAIFDFELSEADMAVLDSLDRNERLGPDPANFDF